MKVGLATLNQTPIAWSNNIDNIKDAIQQAEAQNIELLLMPELSLTGYGCEDLFLSDWVPQKAWNYLIELLKIDTSVTYTVGLPVKYNNHTYNCIAVIGNKQILGVSCKQFLANDGVHYEHRWFTPWEGDKKTSLEKDGQSIDFGDIIYTINGQKVAFEICEDAWRTNRPGLRYAQKNVDYILNPSGSPFEVEKTQRRQDLVCKSSKDFNCTYLYANLLGNESGRLIFDGELLIAKEGNLIARNERFSFKNVNIISDESGLPNVKEDKAYEFRDAINLGLFDYLRKTYSKSFVLSLSGGADSSTCAVMVSEMIKKGIRELGINTFIEKCHLSSVKNEEELYNKLLICAYQGTKNSSKETLESARELANEIGATFYHWEIDEEVTGYRVKLEEATGTTLNWDEHDIALQNIQARARSPIIWMLTNISGALLLTTSNRSEGDVGYATMDGDTSGGLAPIAGIDKHYVRQWLLWAEKELGYKSLSHVNNLQPSAELRPLEQTQTDEEDLMPYDIMVEIEKEAIGLHKSPIEVFEVLNKKLSLDAVALKNYISKFYRMWSQNQWKRERIAPSFHLDHFNVDPRSWFRFPILSGAFREEIEQLQNL